MKVRPILPGIRIHPSENVRRRFKIIADYVNQEPYLGTIWVKHKCFYMVFKLEP